MSLFDRSHAFCRAFGLDVPILLAPMAGVPAPALSVAVAAAGGMGACGVLLMSPADIQAWCAAVRAAGGARFQLNIWVPDPPPRRDAAREAAVRAFLQSWGPEVAADAGDARPPDFDSQCAAMLAAKPTAVSSVMGLFAADYVAALRAAGIKWIAAVSTLAEARAARDAGADAIAVQGFEAGGHRAAFEAARAERDAVGLFALLPAVVDAVDVPVIATGGIADGRGVAAALALGASAVQIGTGFLRAPEAGIPSAWADGLAAAAPEDTALTRAFSGRAGRSLRTDYVAAAMAPGAPEPAPYPVQRGLTAGMRKAASTANRLAALQAWAGQSAGLARAAPAAQIVRDLWAEARGRLGVSAP